MSQRSGTGCRSAKRASNFRAIISFTFFLSTTMTACGNSTNAGDEKRTEEPSSASFSLFALSRGAGVPEPTRAAFQRARQILEIGKERGDVLRFEETRIGLEGERRLCIEAKDIAAAGELLREIRAIAEGIELFNVVEEPCPEQQTTSGRAAPSAL